jgi:hypothetical protein
MQENVGNTTSRRSFLASLRARYGEVRHLERSQSLLEIPGTDVRLYLRYSRMHERGAAFYGLRQKDLRQLEGYRSFICLLWNGQAEPLLLPFAEYEDVFGSIVPGDDGQFKAHLYVRQSGTDFAINRVGRFDVEAHFGWEQLRAAVTTLGTGAPSDLGHAQVQGLLAEIGVAKSHDIWVPQYDRQRIVANCVPRDRLAVPDANLRAALEQLDVVWLNRGTSEPIALFEVEHSTSIYSGLLRFNDIHLLLDTRKSVRFTIVSDEKRRSAYARQLNRPTFLASTLSETCTFLDYDNVYQWHRRVCRQEEASGCGTGLGVQA